MSAKKKAAGIVPTPATANSKVRPHFLTVRRVVKATIVGAALRGWMPYGAADWLIQRGGLANA